VVSVLAAGNEADIDYSNLGLKRDFGPLTFNKHVATYTSLSMEEFARLHPTVSFIHTYPGFVDTPLVATFPYGIGNVFKSLAKFFAISPDESGDIMAYILTTPKYKNGIHLVAEKGNEIPLSHNSRKNIEAIWKHSIQVTEGKK